MYAAAGIPGLWLVNLNRHEIEVHRTPSVDVYKNISILRPGDEVSLPALAVTFRIEELLGPSANS